MKEQLVQIIARALAELGLEPPAKGIQLQNTRDKAHGDFASNIAMMLAKAAGKPPRALAEAIAAQLADVPQIERVEIAGPGFINFFLTGDAARSVVATVLAEGERYGQHAATGQRVQVEFVSANPTGPLHVGHGRGAAYGASLAAILAAAGHEVQREYYVNDAGRQMAILALSVWLRLLEQAGESFAFPAGAYQGDYVRDIARQLGAGNAESLRKPAAEVFADIPPDEPEGGSKDAHLDALIARAKDLLGEAWQPVFAAGLDAILADIRDDLGEFGVHYDEWFSEGSLTGSGAVEHALDALRERGHLYEQDGATWFRSTDFGDEKDRVLVRENGLITYFASDIAYHLNKLERGFDRIIDIWGADHHGYVPRVRAAIQALGHDAERLEVKLVQFAILWRGDVKVPMSTRAGEFVELRELRREVGNDAARYFYVQRSADQHMDFDLELAKSESADNPVYYIQMAHARCCSVFRNKLAEEGHRHDAEAGLARLDLLGEDHETALMTRLSRWPEQIRSAAAARAPHQVAHNLHELAQALHSYYNAHQFVVDDADLRNARLCLVLATRQVLANGLKLLGVNAPEQM